jgi:diguanylate cyclase (GGDEF)-like protein/PAS domain S-box-containing protein
MTDRTELLEAALDSLPEGVALLDFEGNVAFWNRAAEDITGHRSVLLLSQPLPEALEPLLLEGARYRDFQPGTGPELSRGALVQVRHQLGHSVPTMARILALRDNLGGRIGTAAVFHPAESLDALPHGANGCGANVQESQADLEDRLLAEYEDFARSNLAFGVLWITVDQSHELRKTHGARACEAMLEKVGLSLMHGLRPGEEMGRWGDDEFLVISHERTAEMLAAHGQVLVGLARTSDFRWWGDRISLTVSIGAAQANETDKLAQILERAQAAMLESIQAGGNHVTPAVGRQA